MQAILNLDLDFFSKPCYLGNNYQETEYASYKDFMAKATNWLTATEFNNKMNFKHRIRGCKVAEDKQPVFFWKNMIEKGHMHKKFSIVHIDAHHDMYMKHDESFYESMGNRYHNHDNMLAPFFNEWVDEIVWVVPDWYDVPMINSHFKFMKVTGDLYKSNELTIYLSDTRTVKIKVMQWSVFNPDKYDWRYFSMVLNKKIAKTTPEMIQELGKNISEW